MALYPLAFQFLNIKVKLGSISRSCLTGDRSISRKYLRKAGPFESVREFHDWFAGLCRRGATDQAVANVDESSRNDLSDDCAFKFTRSDLHRSNILITPKPTIFLPSSIGTRQSG